MSSVWWLRGERDRKNGVLVLRGTKREVHNSLYLDVRLVMFMDNPIILTNHALFTRTPAVSATHIVVRAAQPQFSSHHLFNPVSLPETQLIMPFNLNFFRKSNPLHLPTTILQNLLPPQHPAHPSSLCSPMRPENALMHADLLTGDEDQISGWIVPEECLWLEMIPSRSTSGLPGRPRERQVVTERRRSR